MLSRRLVSFSERGTNDNLMRAFARRIIFQLLLNSDDLRLLTIFSAVIRFSLDSIRRRRTSSAYEARSLSEKQPGETGLRKVTFTGWCLSNTLPLRNA